MAREPLPARREVVHRDLRLAVHGAGAAVGGDVANAEQAHPRGARPLQRAVQAGLRGGGGRGLVGHAGNVTIGGHGAGQHGRQRLERFLDDLLGRRHRLGPVRGAQLPADVHKLDALLLHLRLVRKLHEARARLGVVHHLGPLALVAGHQLRHLRLQRRPEAEAVIHDDGGQVLKAALHLLQPARRARERPGRADVEHEEAVQDAEALLLALVHRQQLAVRGLGATVAAHVDVVANLRRNQAKVLALRLGALTHAAAHGALELVGRADAAVALLDTDSKADAILQAVAAPGGADAALDGAQRLGVRVAALEAGVHELRPDVGQVALLRAEEVDALAARDLGVQPVFLAHLAQHSQLLRRDLAAGDSGHHGVGAAALDVGEVAVVGVLQLEVLLLEHKLRVLAGQDAADGGLADLAAAAAAVLGQQRVVRGDALRLADVVQLLPREGQVLAQRLVDVLARGKHLLVEQLRDEREAAAAAGAGGRAVLHLPRGGQVLLANSAQDVSLGHVVAGAHLEVVRQRVRVAGGAALAAGRPKHQVTGRRAQRPVALAHAQQNLVVRGVAHEDAAHEARAIRTEHQLLVHPRDGVVLHDGHRFAVLDLGVSKAGDVHAHELELGGHIGFREVAVAGHQVLGHHLRHVVPGRHQAVDHCAVYRVVEAGSLANGVDVRIGACERVVHLHPTTGPKLEVTRTGEIVTGFDAAGDDDHVDVEGLLLILELDPTYGSSIILDEVLCRGAEVDLEPKIFDLIDEELRALIIHLARHQAGRELHDVHLAAQVVGGLRRLEPKQATAEDDAALLARGGVVDDIV
mmetsp:Transcript_11762/g.29601  ORF Transcript_11762/g.29601 Transcript_11762/m.29601 type:complete len:808 (+) Transcript_11762:400-2823(+)